MVESTCGGLHASLSFRFLTVLHVAATSRSSRHASLLPRTIPTNCEPSVVALHQMFYFSNEKNNTTNKLCLFLHPMGLTANVCDSLRWLVCNWCLSVARAIHSRQRQWRRFLEEELGIDLWLDVIERRSWWLYLMTMTVTELMSDSPTRGLDNKQRKPNGFVSTLS